MRSDSLTQTVSALQAQNARIPAAANVLLWVLQGLLAVLFVFAAVVKLTMPAETLAVVSGLPGWFMRFISLAELAGAFGLVVPGIFHLQLSLTRLAAAGLVIIMIGAIVTTVARQGLAPAVFPLIVGNLLTLVIRFRRQGSEVADRSKAPFQWSPVHSEARS